MTTFTWTVPPDPPSPEATPIEVDVVHSQVEVVDYVEHALSRLPSQFRGDS